MDRNALSFLSMAFPKTAGNILDFSREQEGEFSLSDDKTCQEPRRNLKCPSNCDRVQLNISSDRPLTVVAFDDWQSNGNKSRCDYLIFDSGFEKRRFAFCELTCSVEEYVDDREETSGKRAKAFDQMIKTWKTILDSDNPMFNAYLLSFTHKTGIFGWRDRSVGGESGPLRSMRSFTNIPGNKSLNKRYSQYSFGENFEFVQVKYPGRFSWD